MLIRLLREENSSLRDALDKRPSWDARWPEELAQYLGQSRMNLEELARVLDVIVSSLLPPCHHKEGYYCARCLLEELSAWIHKAAAWHPMDSDPDHKGNPFSYDRLPWHWHSPEWIEKNVMGSSPGATVKEPPPPPDDGTSMSPTVFQRTVLWGPNELDH
jgi:hypothetical protein